MDKIRVKVTSYKDNLIIETIKPDEDKNFVPVGNGRLGCVLIDTKELLGMSEEAVKLMKTLPRNNDAIGDVSTWKTTEGQHCFAWFGNLKRLVDVKKCESDRDGIIDIDHITIPNEPPKEAIEAIDS